MTAASTDLGAALSRSGDVFVLRLDAGENRFRPETLALWSQALDEVEAATGPRALVTTGSGKFYSNGLDLEYMTASGDPGGYLAGVLGLIARVLVFPAWTVCAINGHAFGAGALIALAHDARVMRRDRGYFCMPEVDMKLPLHPGMTAVLQARLPRQTAHEVIASGTRYGGEHARARHIVDEVADEALVLPRAIELAQALAPKADPAMGKLKRGMYPEVLEALARKLDGPV